MSNVAPSKKGKNGKMVKRWSQISKNFAIFWVVVSSVFLFSPLLGEMIQFDKYFSKGLKPPTSCFFVYLPGVSSISWTYRSTCTKATVAGRVFHLGNYRVVTKKILRYQHWNSPGCLFSFVDFSIEEETKSWNLWSIAKKIVFTDP